MVGLEWSRCSLMHRRSWASDSCQLFTLKLFRWIRSRIVVIHCYLVIRTTCRTERGLPALPVSLLDSSHSDYQENEPNLILIRFIYVTTMVATDLKVKKRILEHRNILMSTHKSWEDCTVLEPYHHAICFSQVSSQTDSLSIGLKADA